MRTDRILYAGLGLVTILALPACGLAGAPPTLPGPNFDPGPTPQNHVVFCDIELIGETPDLTFRTCVDDDTDQDEVATSIPFTHAAIALNNGDTSMTALDLSPAAVSRCGKHGEIVRFHGFFPQGSPVCLNCGAQIPKVYPDANAVCQAICADLSEPLQNPPSPDVATFCANHAHVSTNVPADGCPAGFDSGCTDAGSLSTFFVDPRVFPEPVLWTQLVGTDTSGLDANDLTMTAPTDPGGAFTAQAVSSQIIKAGDVYVEFSVGETTATHVIGFHSNPPAVDTDPTPNDIDFALRLGLPMVTGSPGLLFVSHLGTVVPGPGASGELDTYQANDRFRITLTDQNDGTFSVQYDKVVNGMCAPGNPCNLHHIYTDTVMGQYPVQVDTSFRDQGARLINVTVVRIQPPQ